MTWTDAAGQHRLGHSFCGGRLQRVAMIDDYANMANAALALYSVTRRSNAYLGPGRGLGRARQCSSIGMMPAAIF